MRIPLQASLRDACSPKGAPLGNAANFTAFRKAVPLGKVDANAVSRRKGCIPGEPAALITFFNVPYLPFCWQKMLASRRF